MGRSASAGTRKVIEHASEAGAQREYDAQIWKRIDHGDSRVVDDSKPRDATAAREKKNVDALAKSAPLTKNARFHVVHRVKGAARLEVRGSMPVRDDDARAILATKYGSDREATRTRDAATAKVLAEGYELDAFGSE